MAQQAIKFKKVSIYVLMCVFLLLVCYHCSPNGLSWLVQALYVNNSINDFMYGFLDVEEGYDFEENQCTVKYGEWDICIHFTLN